MLCNTLITPKFSLPGILIAIIWSGSGGLTASAFNESSDPPQPLITQNEYAQAAAAPTSCPLFTADQSLYPFTTKCFQTTYGKMSYVDEGPASAADVVLLIHGNPTWSFLYRNIISGLKSSSRGSSLRIVAPDIVGFGRSEKPSQSTFSYTPEQQSLLIDQLVESLNLQNITLVVQDWGGPMGLAFAERNPQRISRLYIMNTWAWPVSESQPGNYHRLVDWSVTNRTNSSSYTRNCTTVTSAANSIALAVDPSQGSLYQSVKTQYRLPFFSSGNTKRSSDVCAPTVTMATFILDGSNPGGFLEQVNNGLSSLASRPVGFFFGRKDVLFGDLRVDIGNNPPCPSPTSPICDPDYLKSGQICTSNYSDTPDAWVCRYSSGDAFIPSLDDFKKTFTNVVIERTDKTADHFVQEYAPTQITNDILTLLNAP
jgi:pimeloyl-ACP methyl ester carboxylesterase